MKKVALWGYYGFGNVGDEALLHATLPYLENTNVRLFSGDVPSVTESKNLQIVPRSLKNLLSTTRNTDAFVLGPGGLLHERKKSEEPGHTLPGLFWRKGTKNHSAQSVSKLAPLQEPQHAILLEMFSDTQNLSRPETTHLLKWQTS